MSERANLWFFIRTQHKKNTGGQPNMMGAAKALPMIPCREEKKGTMLAIRYEKRSKEI
jgi:hypothetical protein